MADLGEAFRQSLDRFILTDVTPMGSVLGNGSYGSVEEVKYNRIVCAGKKLYEALIEEGNQGVDAVAQKYLQECQLMSELRHPNITQFLGICFLPGNRLPLLVMERLETSVDDLIENAPNLPLCLKCSFLEDIACGLLYLHGRQPPVIHRDLTAKNVLLTSSLDAKITDMGNSRMIDLKPGQLGRTLSKLPGTLVYMPPEALDDRTCYGPPLDIFSFGHLTLFAITQVFPGTLLPSTYLDPDNDEAIRGRSEIERRVEYLDILEAQVATSHPGLIRLVKDCLHNAPQRRPTTNELFERLQRIRPEVEEKDQLRSSHAKLEVMRERLGVQTGKTIQLKASAEPVPKPRHQAASEVTASQPTPRPKPAPRQRHKTLPSSNGLTHSSSPVVNEQRDLTSLEQQEWYWGNTSVLDILQKLQAIQRPNGSFLIYDSDIEGEYDLCAQKDGTNAFLHISYCNHTYGFFDYSSNPPRALFKFPTVPAFVQHYKKTPLKLRTDDDVYIDVTLTNPISKSEMDPVEQQDLLPLKEHGWYWGKRKLQDMKEKLRGMSDGTFLVCDSQYEGEFVLVVTQSGNTELADISYSDNKYGICNHSLRPVQPTISFHTLPTLIGYYRHAPLRVVTRHNVFLNVTLAHSVSRFTMVQNEEKSLNSNTLPLKKRTAIKPPSVPSAAGPLHLPPATAPPPPSAANRPPPPPIKLPPPNKLPPSSALRPCPITLQPLPPLPTHLNRDPCSLQDQGWYWETSNVAAATNKLDGKPEGSFLVCGSYKEDRFTLFVRNGGKNEIIHICHVKEKYGFFDVATSKPVLLKFLSLPALVEHYRKFLLTEYNSRINIKLAYPISRFDEKGAIGGSKSALEDQEWYWGDISSEVIREELDGKPDGTFLVRDSRKIGNYTLAVQMNKSIHFARINCNNGKYGFVDTTENPPVFVEFSSVPDFVEYFKVVSLSKFNAGLDIKLLYPHPKVVPKDEPLYEEVELYDSIDEITAQLASLPKLPNRIDVAPRPRRRQQSKPVIDEDDTYIYQATEQEEEDIYVYDDAALLSKPVPSDDKIYVDPLPLTTDEDDLYDDISGIVNADTLEDENEDHYYVPSNDESDSVPTEVIASGPTSVQESGYLELSELLPHTNRESWFCNIDRNKAVAMLRGKPTGTFLCRPTKTLSRLKTGAVHTHTIDIVYNDAPAHLRVLQKNKMFGFETNSSMFSSLKELVLHFALHPIHHSCDIPLKHPINAK